MVCIINHNDRNLQKKTMVNDFISIILLTGSNNQFRFFTKFLANQIVCDEEILGNKLTTLGFLDLVSIFLLRYMDECFNLPTSFVYENEFSEI